MIAGLGGARISGTGPEKSLPVIRDRYSMSTEVYFRNREHEGNQILTRSRPVIKAVIYSGRIPFIFHFEFVFA
jgi:hypothetical protein